MFNCKACKNLIPDDSDFCPFCGNKVVRNVIDNHENSEPLHLYQPEALLKRAFLFLEERLFDKADTYVEAALNQEPENAEAYLVKLLIDLRASSIDELSNLDKAFDDNINYKRALKYGDEQLKDRLLSANDEVTLSIARRQEEERIRQEENRCFTIYREARHYMSADTEVAYIKAAELFKGLKDYKDSAELAKKCKKLAEELRLDGIYKSAIACMANSESVSNQQMAIALFRTIPNWRDSTEKLIQCEHRIEEILKQEQAKLLEDERKAGLERLRRANIEQRIKKIAKTVLIVAAITMLLVSVVIVVLNTIIIPTYKYSDALGFMNENNYEEAASLFEELDGYKDSEDKLNECKVMIDDVRYNEALALMNDAKYDEAVELFKELDGYKDCQEKINECHLLLFDEKYKEADRLLSVKKYSEALAVFKEIEGYKDSTKKIDECNQLIIGDKYDNAISLMESGEYEDAINIFKMLDDYKDSKIKLEECNNAANDNKYNKAISLMNSENYVEALDIFKTLNGYKDSEDMIDLCDLNIKADELKSVTIGSYIKFGKYNQFKYSGNYNTLSNIEWLVLDKKDNKILVTSRYVLDCKKFNEKEEYTTWENCGIRTWLNDYFYNYAFSNLEKELITTTSIDVFADNHLAGTVLDKVFLLSKEEVEKYFVTDKERGCRPTPYAEAQGVFKDNTGNCWWWLRSRGIDHYKALGVCRDGTFSAYGISVSVSNSGVRPAMWIKLNT